MKRARLIVCSLLCLIVVGFFPASPVKASATIYVPDNYSTIQAAVDAASPGDTIIVRDGTYTENVDVYKEHLTIRSETGSEHAIVEAANPNEDVLKIDADYVSVDGFTVTGDASGISLHYADHCSISNNIATNSNDGITLDFSNNNTISNNTVSDNYNRGMFLAYSSNNTIKDNDAGRNIWDGIFLWLDSNDNTLTDNNASGNGYSGIVLYESPTNNRISNNDMSSNGDHGLYLLSSSGNYIFLNDFTNNGQNADSDNSTNNWNSMDQISYTYKGNNHVDYLGNHWGNYPGIDANGDGIGDTPYLIGSDQDNYPLMESFENYLLGEISPAPSGLVRISPDNNPLPAFKWNAVVGAVTYEVRIDAENWLSIGDELTYVQPTILGEGAHVFSLRSVDTSAVAGAASSLSFDVSVRADLANTRIAFASDRDGDSDIYLMNADGTNQVNITNDNVSDGWPEWSPDGRKIAFVSNRDHIGGQWYEANEIYTMNADGSNVTRLTFNARNDEMPAWSPDGTRIAFVSQRDSPVQNVMNSEIYVMNADGSAQTRLTYHPVPDEWPAWSPDGTRIAFAYDRSGSRSDFQMWIMNADGTDQAAFLANTTVGAETQPLKWSPNGREIVFGKKLLAGDGPEQTRSWEIYKANADLSGQTNLTNNSVFDEWPDWSPDGNKIVFYSLGDGYGNVYAMNADGSGQTPLTIGTAGGGSPAWSPFLAGESPPPSGLAVGDEVKVFDVGSAGLRIHADSPTGDTLELVPDGWTLRIVSGPQLNVNGHDWWRVRDERYESSPAEGWAAGDYLIKVPAADLRPTSPPDYFTAGQAKVEAAIAWATQQEAESTVHRNGDNASSGECLKFVRLAFDGPPIGWGSPEDARSKLENEGQFFDTATGLDPPRGALVFFSALDEFQPYGHVGLYLGNQGVVHLYDKVRVDTAETNIAKGIVIVEGLGEIGSYLGWAYPPEEWLSGLTNQPPFADFKPDYAEMLSGETINFDASASYDVDGTIIDYEWDFGDGETSSGAIVNHRFRGKPGEGATVYNVTLSVRDNNGATGDVSNHILVDPIQKTITVEDLLVVASITVRYNWIGITAGTDTYIVSRMYVYSVGLIGLISPSITIDGDALWSDALITTGANDFDYTSPFEPKSERFGVSAPVQSKTFFEGTYNGIEVLASDSIKLWALGPTGTKKVAGGMASSTFDPDTPVEHPLEPYVNQTLGEGLMEAIKSPCELRLYDTEGRVTGVMNTETREEIPYSKYSDEKIVVLGSHGGFQTEVAAIEEGAYGLSIALVRDGQVMIFVASDINVRPGALHKYSMNWTALSEGQEGVTVQVDSNGDGIFDKTFTCAASLTADEFNLKTQTTVSFNPQTLKLSSSGNMTTAYIQLPTGYYPANIDVSTIKLNGQVPALSKPTSIADYNHDGIPDLMVKFDRSDVQDLFGPQDIGNTVEIIVSGNMTDGTRFAGVDHIKIMK